MAFFGLFKKNEQEMELLLRKRRQGILPTTAAAAAFAESGEHATARDMAEESGDRRKLLVIGKGNGFSARLVQYALETAMRLDSEIIALNVTSSPLALTGEERENATAAFARRCTANVVTLRERARAAGIAFSHLVEIGGRDDIVGMLHARHPGLRYILSEPGLETTSPPQGSDDISFLDLESMRGTPA